MFYRQCNDCNERWELGTTSTCTCVKDEPYAFEASMYSNDRMKVDPVTGNVSIGTPQQEAKDKPVAWRAKNTYENQEGWFYAEWHPDGLTPQVAELLYTTPPQRTWVGLTDEDISEIVRGTHNTGSFVRAIEAKLKEKNT